MSKRIAKQIESFKYNGEPVRMTFGTLIVTGLCILLIITATFTQLTIIHPYIPFDTFAFLAQDTTGVDVFGHFRKSFQYIPQIPVILLISALLGRKFGLLAVLGYIILGMFSPVFALGGGVKYMFEYGFGYILAFLPALFLAGTLLKDKFDFKYICLAALCGVMVIHVLGIVYLLFISTLKHDSADAVISWLLSLSGMQVFYDIFFSVISVYLGRKTRELLWFVMC